MDFKMKIVNEKARDYYENHGHFHKGDSGLDLYVLEDVLIKKNETVLIKLGIACESLSNKSYYLMPRSSISKTPLRMSNSIGLIDAGYRGEIMASCDNIKDFDYHVKTGERLFQLVSPDASPITYVISDSLSETTRGTGGFGSTGK
tara:strand:- start:475 stop:912 length:438 start_codon:yes stop_codon:yes gene_type:complete